MRKEYDIEKLNPIKNPYIQKPQMKLDGFGIFVVDMPKND